MLSIKTLSNMFHIDSSRYMLYQTYKDKKSTQIEMNTHKKILIYNENIQNIPRLKNEK